MYIIKNKKQQHENQEKKGFERGNIYVEIESTSYE